MFCSNCGTEVPSDSKFCTSCGGTIGGKSAIESIKEISFDHEAILKFAMESIKNPIASCKAANQTLNKKIMSIYFFVGVLLTAIMSAITVNFIASGLIKKMMVGSGMTSYMGQKELIGVQALKGSILPFSKVLLWSLIGIVIFYLLIVGVIGIVNKAVNKKNIDLLRNLIIISVAITIQLASSMVILVTSFISIWLTILVMIVTSVIISFVLYTGYSELVEVNNFFVYIFALILVVIFAISNYVIYKLAISHIGSTFLGGSLGTESLFDLMDIF